MSKLLLAVLQVFIGRSAIQLCRDFVYLARQFAGKGPVA